MFTQIEIKRKIIEVVDLYDEIIKEEKQINKFNKEKIANIKNIIIDKNIRIGDLVKEKQNTTTLSNDDYDILILDAKKTFFNSIENEILRKDKMKNIHYQTILILKDKLDEISNSYFEICSKSADKNEKDLSILIKIVQNNLNILAQMRELKDKRTNKIIETFGYKPQSDAKLYNDYAKTEINDYDYKITKFEEQLKVSSSNINKILNEECNVQFAM